MDIFAVSEETMWLTSEMLWSSPEFEPYMPLGERGGVMGIVRDAVTGEPLQGVEIHPNQPTEALIAYPDFQSWSDTGESTGPEGLFVIMNPGLGESFYADAGFSGESPPRMVLSTEGILSAISFAI